MRVYSLISVLWLDEGLLGDEDTIEELSIVLITDAASLVDPGACKRKRSIINSVEDKLILNVSGLGHGSSSWEFDVMGLLTTQEVNDFKRVLVLGDLNVDGEMIVDKSHLISEALFSKHNQLVIWVCSFK